MKKTLVILFSVLCLSPVVQANFLSMMDQGAFEAILTCLQTDNQDETQRCLFEKKGEGQENQSACFRSLWNDSSSVGGEKSVEELSFYNLMKTSAKVSVRFCRAASLIFGVENFLADHAIAKYQYCDPKNEEVMKISSMIIETETSMLNDPTTKDIATQTKFMMEQINLIGAQLDQMVCEGITKGSIQLPESF